MQLDGRTRPLTEAERRLLRCKARQHGLRPGHVERAAGLGAGVVGGGLWLLTLLATDVSWPVVTVFWLVLGGLIYLWVLRDLRKEAAHLPTMVAAMEGALRRDEAESFDVAARAYAELEEVEDEGAFWAFDLGDDRIVVLAGQQFYPSARFPSLDFSVVYPLDEDGGYADMWLQKRGPAVPPARVLPAALKRELAGRLPEPLEVLEGPLAELEELLRRRAEPGRR